MPDTASGARAWPRNMRRAKAVNYLRDVHGIDIDEKTLRNRNAAGHEPRPKYLGTIPFYTPAGLDAWAETAFTEESPVAVTRRRAAEVEARRRAAEAPKRRRREAETLPPAA